MTTPAIFVSYSHTDESWKNELVKHLSVHKENYKVSLWHDRDISTGTDWYREICQAIDEACLAVVLVSASSLGSDFINNEEVPRFLERQKNAGLVIYPIIVSPCNWKSKPWLKRLQVRPRDGRPLSGGNQHQVDADLSEIAREILSMLVSKDGDIGGDEIVGGVSDAAVAIATAVQTDSASVELTIDDDISTYTPQKQAALLKAIANLLEIDGEIKVKSKRPGSVKLRIEVTPAQAERLLLAIEAGKFVGYGVTGAAVIDDDVAAGDEHSSLEESPTERVVGADASDKAELRRIYRRGTLELPATVNLRNKSSHSYVIVAVHGLALLALLPYFFSWPAVWISLAGCYLFGALGINLCYHRLLTHQGFELPKWLERTFATLGVCCLEGTPTQWVATERLHHQYSDERPDPHSPSVMFFWAHFGWLTLENVQISTVGHYEKYARDVLRDPFYMALELNKLWIWVNLAHWAGFFAMGFVGQYVFGISDFQEAVRMGLSLLVWGVFVRTVLVWHVRWSINSVCHRWGYRNYETDENSRNNVLVALLSCGDGWHNNHHADQRSAKHGHKWWEVDVTWLTIRLLEIVGLARKVVRPSRRLVDVKTS